MLTFQKSKSSLVKIGVPFSESTAPRQNLNSRHLLVKWSLRGPGKLARPQPLQQQSQSLLVMLGLLIVPRLPVQQSQSLLVMLDLRRQETAAQAVHTITGAKLVGEARPLDTAKCSATTESELAEHCEADRDEDPAGESLSWQENDRRKIEGQARSVRGQDMGI